MSSSTAQAQARSTGNFSEHISVLDLSGTSIAPDLWYRIHVFLFDLQNYNERNDSKKRLEEAGANLSYIGMPYFDTREAAAIRNAENDGRAVSQILETGLQERFERRSGKRVGSEDYRVCAAHDLAPILGQALRIDYRRLSKDIAFRKLLDKHGLRLDTHWTGLQAKSFAPKNRRKK